MDKMLAKVTKVDKKNGTFEGTYRFRRRSRKKEDLFYFKANIADHKELAKVDLQFESLLSPNLRSNTRIWQNRSDGTKGRMFNVNFVAAEVVS